MDRSEMFHGFDDFVKEKMDQWQVPGASVAVIHNTEIIYSQGFGFKNLNDKTPVTPETVFAIGSATKPFTTTAMGILVDEGKLDWDKPVIAYLSDFKMYDSFATERITPRDLACHRSGLPRHELVWYNAPVSREEIFNRLPYLEPNKDFRTTWQYQNLMYITAGYLIEKISGLTWEKFVSENLLAPLEMNNSNFSVDELQKSANYALPYTEKDEELIEIPFRNINTAGPAGSINSNLEDMAKWVLLQLNKGIYKGRQIISQGNLAQLHTPQMVANPFPWKFKEKPILTYGLGWFIEPYRGFNLIHHGGNIDGFSALVSFMPEEKIGTVILTNMNGSLLPEILTLNICDRLLGLEQIDWHGRLKEKNRELKETLQQQKIIQHERVANTSPSHPLSDYTGEYEHPGYGKLAVKMENGELIINYNAFEFPLNHHHYDIFKLLMEPFEVTVLATFYTDTKGNISSVSIPMEPSPGIKEILFNRIPQQAISDKAFLVKCTGEYTFAGMELSVTLRKEKTLIVSIPGQPELELVPYQGNTFNIKNTQGFSVKFKLDDSGNVCEADFTQPNGIFAAKKK